jgi:ubiquitin
MQIFVKSINGITMTIEVEPTDTVLALKEKIEARECISPRSQRIICAGKQLQDSYPLQEYHHALRTTLYVLFRLPGG